MSLAAGKKGENARERRRQKSRSRNMKIFPSQAPAHKRKKRKSWYQDFAWFFNPLATRRFPHHHGGHIPCYVCMWVRWGCVEEEKKHICCDVWLLRGHSGLFSLLSLLFFLHGWHHRAKPTSSLSFSPPQCNPFGSARHEWGIQPETFVEQQTFIQNNMYDNIGVCKTYRY